PNRRRRCVRASTRRSTGSFAKRGDRSMDNTRLFLWLALLAMLWLNYDAWLRDRAPAQTSRIPPAAEVDRANDDVPDIGAPSVDAPASAPPAAESRAPAMPIRVRTDVLDVVIDTEG